MPIFRKKSTRKVSYDPAAQQPAVRKSICTGEMTVGFIDRGTGKFREYMLVRDRTELEAFCQSIDVDPENVQIIY